MEASAANYSELAAQHAEENSKTFDELEEDKLRREDRLERDPEYDTHVVRLETCVLWMKKLFSNVHTSLQQQFHNRACCAIQCPARLSRWPHSAHASSVGFWASRSERLEKYISCRSVFGSATLALSFRALSHALDVNRWCVHRRDPHVLATGRHSV